MSNVNTNGYAALRNVKFSSHKSKSKMVPRLWAIKKLHRAIINYFKIFANAVRL